MKNKLLLIALVAAVLVGGYFIMKKSVPPMNTDLGVSDEASGVINDATSPSGEIVTDGVVEATLTPGDAMKKVNVTEITLDGFEFGYDQKSLTVKKGDTVKLTLTNSGKMPHDWVVDEFNAKTKRITNGQTDTITFVADKAGTFEFYCSVGQHRANGMVGKLIVE